MPRRHLTEHARELRKNLTDAERVLWRILRNRRLLGLKFRRQHVIGPFILDFYCATKGLAIEVDGGGHGEDEQIRYDGRRTAYLQDHGVRVVRFWNHDVLRRTDTVMAEIYRILTAEA